MKIISEYMHIVKEEKSVFMLGLNSKYSLDINDVIVELCNWKFSETIKLFD